MAFIERNPGEPIGGFSVRWPGEPAGPGRPAAPIRWRDHSPAQWLRFGLGLLVLFDQVASERHAMSGMGQRDFRDMGIDAASAQRESGRSMFDLPAGRVAALRREIFGTPVAGCRSAGGTA